MPRSSWERFIRRAFQLDDEDVIGRYRQARSHGHLLVSAASIEFDQLTSGRVSAVRGVVAMRIPSWVELEAE